MPFIVDDRFHSHAKTLAICLAARGLWVSVGSWSADHGTNGAVPHHVLLAMGATPDLIADLVRARMWGETPEGIEFHDWAFWNSLAAAPETAQEATLELSGVSEPARPVSAPRTPGARRVAMGRVPGLKRKLHERDGGQCRYCARPVRWGKGRAVDSGTWDWVEPGGPASPENIVTACKACGKRKAGRSLKDSGMVLLAPPAPEKRYTPCNASDLGIQDGNAYADSSNAYSGETAGQKRYTQAQQDDHLDRSKSSSGLGSKPVPVLTGRARKAKPGTAEFRLHVIKAFAAKHLIEITTAEADALAAEVLGRAKDPVPCPIAYVLRAVDSETNPFTRWFPYRAEPELAIAPAVSNVRPPHCGDPECSEGTRRREDAATGDDLGPCWKCSPNSFAASEWRAAEKRLAS